MTTTTQLAPPDTASTGAMTAGSDRYLTFVLGGEVFALPILDITEIMEYRNLTVVPMMPAFLRGVINLRGRVVPVVDMAARFGRGSTGVARRTSIIIVEIDGTRRDDVLVTGDAGTGGTTAGPERSDDTARHMGIMVDAVNKVVHLGRDDIEPPPAFGAGIRSDFISGMAKFEDEFIIVLDVTRVLSMEEMVQLSRSPGAAHDEAAAEVSAG